MTTTQDPNLLTFGNTTKGEPNNSKNQNPQENLNKKALNTLPPDVDGATYGYMFLEIGQMESFVYDGVNYLEEGSSSKGKAIYNLFANIKFWGDQTKGVYLKCSNGMKKSETVTNKFKYDIKCPEKVFEKYLDDMGVLVVDFFDTNKNQTVGTSKIMMKLYIKRAKKDTDEGPLLELRGSFPINLTGNQNVKIGQFNISLVSSFPSAQSQQQNQMNTRQKVNMDDSFEENERLAQKMTSQDRNKMIIENTFRDDRVPSSLVGKRNDSQYVKKDFVDFEIDERPTRERPQNQRTDKVNNKENQRNLINIDESEDTFTHQEQFERIFARGEKLRQQMDQAMDTNMAWETIHGHHEISKKYVPPFLREEEKKSANDEHMDHLYELEIEGYELRESKEQIQTQQITTQNIQGMQTGMTSQQFDNQGSHIRDMKYIKIKINTLRIENEELLHELIDQTFSVTIDLPLPDVYQKKISFQTLKLNNYDIVSFNEFVFNNSSLYNFKIDEETFNQLVSSTLKVGIEGKKTTGNLNMIKLLMSKNYKVDVSIPLERLIDFEEVKQQPKKKTDNKKGPAQKQDQRRKTVIDTPISQPITKLVGHLTLELQLQRGDNEQELAREYQVKYMQLQEQKAKEESERQAEMQKYLKFSQAQEPQFASLYLNINKIRNLCLNSDGTLNQQMHDESFNQRQNMSPRTPKEEAKSMISGISNFQQQNPPVPPQPRRNLFVQYKNFPTLEKLRTNVMWNDSEPLFSYRQQFPLIINPDTIQKLQNFTFILEIWDQVNPSKEEFIGLVKIPLASFCYSMKTQDDQIYSLNALADQHNLYPLLIADGYVPIYSPRLGMNVGEISLILGLGTAIQINRQILKEQEQEKQHIEMTMKTQMLELMKQKQQERVTIQLEKNEQPPPEPESAVSPSKSLLGGLLSGNGGEENALMKNIGNMLRSSVQMSFANRDFDTRKQSYVNCLRKLFEEARINDIDNINGDQIFKEIQKNFDGTVRKDDFIYAILNTKNFTLTRTEISNICALMLNISESDQNNIDIEEIQKGYRQYLTYYDPIEQRIKDLLEKILICIRKKIETDEEYEEFIRQIEEKSLESKISITELRDLFDNNGIVIRDAIYDQLSANFDLDRNGQIYITSFMEFLRNPTMNKFNFFKVHPLVLVNLVAEYIKNEVQSHPDTLIGLEKDFKLLRFKKKKLTPRSPRIEDVPDDYLTQERINAKEFQTLLRKYNINLTLWEIFTLFDHLNTTYSKMYYEPQRYHEAAFTSFYKFITNVDYENMIKEEQIKKQIQKNLQDQLVKASMDSVFGLAADLNQGKRKGIDDSEGIYSNKSDISEEEVVIKKDKNKKKRDITFDKQESSSQINQIQDDNRPYKKVKHIFEIKVKELKNIPILDKLIKDLNSYETSTQFNQQSSKFKKKDSNKYIQNVAVKYSFPLDEDEIFQSDFIQLNTENLEQLSQYDYKVSINTVHNYIMNKDDKIQKVLKESTHQQESLFNISLVIYENNKEFVIGNAQLPIEDLTDIVDTYNVANTRQTLSRVLFIYGTTFSQRENCIIGKLQLEINYNIEKQFTGPAPNITDDNSQLINEEAKQVSDEEDNQACFLHRETFIKRKIPLSAVINVEIERIHNLKESLENIEHFSKIQQSAMRETSNERAQSKHSVTSKISKSATIAQTKDQVDRRRILTNIFKQGLNLSIIGSLFEEDADLKKRFPNSKYTSRMLYNTLNPIYNEGFELGVQMDTSIFEYLKNKKAVFEIRHYILQKKQQDDQNLSRLMTYQQEAQIDSNRSQISEEEENIMAQSDYITLGYVRVPLLHLITKNNGIDGDFVIFDDYKQQMGTLKLRINLNHHSSQRPLYSEQNNTLPGKTNTNLNQRTTIIDQTVMNAQTFARTGKPLMVSGTQYILGINFIELIFKNREQMIDQIKLSQSLNQQSFLYLKFKLFNQSFQTKFISTQSDHSNQSLKALNISIFDIKKTALIELDFMRQQEIEEALSKPIEVQLWFKKESTNKYQQAEKEQLLGSFFIEMNELSKIRNRRIKDSNGQFQSYEGYFTLYDYEREQVVPDRLGCKIYLFKKEYETQLSDLEVLLHNTTQIDQQISKSLDPTCKGYAELDDLLQVVSQNLQDPYLSLIKAYISNLEYKNSDKVFYSSLFGEIPPFFRYARRFDSFGVIEKFNKELSSIDTHGNGFVPIGLFRSIMEHELKIKEKIVQDFLQNLRDSSDVTQQLQTLDVNIFSHSFKNHIDYVILLRKLGHYYEIRNSDRMSTERQMITEEGKDEVLLKIDIEGAMRLKNPFNELEPPNSFVLLKLPLNSTPQQIQTNTIQKSSYPTWHQIGQQVRFNMSDENVRQIIDQPLEFEIYHSQLGYKDAINNQLIGVAYVDLSQMVFVDGVNQIGGYFHIVNKDRFKQGTLTLIDPSRLSMESLGQIKLGITTNTNLKRLTQNNPAQRTIVRENSPIKENPSDLQQQYHNVSVNNPFGMSFARESQTQYQFQQQNPLIMSQTHQKMEFSMNQIGLNLLNKGDIDLKQSLSQQLSALDELNRKLSMKSKLREIEEKEQNQEEFKERYLNEQQPFSDPYTSGLAITMGYHQSADLKNQLQPFKNNNPLSLKFDIPRANIIQEQNEDELDLDKEDSLRRDNVFANNQSESSKHLNEDLEHAMEGSNDQYMAQPSIEEEDDFTEDQYPMRETFNQNQNVFEQNILSSDGDQNVNSNNAFAQSEVKKNPRFDFDIDDDYDDKELERIEKIMKSQRK